MKTEIYKTVTDEILTLLKEGTVPWNCPWERDFTLPSNWSTKKTYSGINILLLFISAGKHGFESSSWMTFKQAKKLGGNIIEGSKSTKIVWFEMIQRKDRLSGELLVDANDEPQLFPCLRVSSVFNLNQIEGLEIGHLSDDDMKHEIVWEPNQIAENCLDSSGAVIHHGGQRAFYQPSSDLIRLPGKHRFSVIEDYYSTALHELTHWTGHSTRLDRNSKYGSKSESYAFEELVAEIGSAFLCADFHVRGTTQDHANYIGDYIELLENDERALFKAARLASQAHTFLRESMTWCQPDYSRLAA